MLSSERPPIHRARWPNPLLWLLAFSLALISSFTVRIGHFITNVSVSQNSETVRLVLEDGLNSRQIAAKLKASGVIRDEWAFVAVTKYLGLDRKLKAGVYEIKPHTGLEEVVRRLASGDVVRVRLTVPEGERLEGIAGILETSGLGSRERFLALARGEVARFQPEVMGTSFEGLLEGYLFPDTYEFPISYSEEEVILAMLRRFCQVVLPEYEAYSQSEGERALTLPEVITLASLVEREAKLDSERPVIASVFLNRLRLGMPLESCASVEYALGSHRERLTYDDLRVNSPYNTYVNKGLPPSPIANPGLASIRAVLSPADTTYLYFFANGDGSHHFSKTYKDHLSAQARKLKRS